MKKTLFALSFFILISFTSKSQRMLSTGKGLGKFLESTLYLPITGYKPLDDVLKSSFESYWKVTPFKFVKAKEFAAMEEQHIKEVLKKSYVETQPSNFLFHIINKSVIGKSSFSITDICEIDSWVYSGEILRSSSGLDKGEWVGKNKPKEGSFDNIIYRLPYIIKAMNEIITITKENNLGDDGSDNVYCAHSVPTQKQKKQCFDLHADLADLINKNAHIIKNKTLVLNRDMKYNKKEVYKDEDEFKKYYPYSYKFVSNDEFNEILQGNSDEYVCYVPSYWQQDAWLGAYEFVYEPSTKNTLYREYVYKFNRVEKRDIDLLIKAIGK